MDLNTIEAVLAAGDRAPADWSERDAWLAGGTWLFSEPQPHLRRLHDLTGRGGPATTISSDGVLIAATCTFAELAGLALPDEWRAAPLLRQCCDALLGSFKIWNVATIGGNLCLALPAGPVAALATALDGTCRVGAPDGGEREIAAADFVLGDRQTVLRPGEVLRSIVLPAHALVRRTVFRRASLTPLGRSAALLIGTVEDDGRFALTVTAATLRPVVLRFPNLPSADELRQAVAAIPSDLYVDDVHGAPTWRRRRVLDLADAIRAEVADIPNP